MASGELPIKFQEHLQLSAVSVPDDAIGFTTCTLESDKYVWYVFFTIFFHLIISVLCLYYDCCCHFLLFIKLTLVIIVSVSEKLPQMVTWWPLSTSMITTL